MRQLKFQIVRKSDVPKVSQASRYDAFRDAAFKLKGTESIAVPYRGDVEKARKQLTCALGKERTRFTTVSDKTKGILYLSLR